MFKVGDRVRVVSEGANFTGRPHASLGMTGEIISACSYGGAGVRLDQPLDGVSEWSYDPKEIALITDLPSDAPTLLDQFAMAALTGLVAQSNGTAFGSDKDDGAKWAYDMAQAMMKAREGQK